MLTETNIDFASIIQFGFLVKRNIVDFEIYIPHQDMKVLNEEDVILVRKDERNMWTLFVIPVNGELKKFNVKNLNHVDLILHELKTHHTIFSKDFKIEKRKDSNTSLKIFNQFKNSLSYKFLKMNAWN